MSEGTVKAKERVRQIEAQKQRLEAVIGDLFAVAKDLEERLEQVVHQATPRDDEESKDSEELVPLALYLSGRANQLEKLLSQQRNLVNRIEL